MIDPNTLFSEASCFRCNSDASLSDLLKLALLQRIAEAGGGGGGGIPGGAANSVQFNDAGAFGGFGSFNSGTSVLTIPGDLLFNTDNADDIGASGASRPRTGYFGTSVVTPLVASPAATALSFASAGTTRANFDTSGNLLFNTDGANNIGAAGANRPLRGHFSSGVTCGVSVTTPVVVSAGVLALAATSSMSFDAGGSTRWNILALGHLTATTDNAVDIGNSGALRPRNLFLAGSITTGATTLHTTSAALTDGAGAGAGTITNAPSAGDPTKWISIIDNGTTRWLPSWT